MKKKINKLKYKKVYVIAEIGNTHEGSLGLAKKFAEVASNCGVDAVKFQTHIFSDESLDNSPNPPYFQDETRKEYFKRTSFSKSEWMKLKTFCENKLKIDFLSTPFSNKSVNLLRSIGSKAIKISSGDVNNIPLLENISKLGIKIFMSSGMSNWQEIEYALNILLKNKKNKITLLQCTSQYPCPPEKSGLNIITEMKHKYPNINIGFSDHTKGIAIPLAAICYGATVIEKHFTLSNQMYGSDAMNSTAPKEFKNLVIEIRNLEKALNSNIKKISNSPEIKKMKFIFEKSIVLSRDLPMNHIIKKSDLKFKKPGNGILTSNYTKIIGKTILKKLFSSKTVS